MLTGQPALVDSTCPRWGEQASDYSAVCLETGETEYRNLPGTSSSATSATFLRQLHATIPAGVYPKLVNGTWYYSCSCARIAPWRVREEG